MRVSFLLTGLAVAALLASVPRPSGAAELVVNGGFETATWTQSHQFGPGAPAQTSPSVPVNGTGIAGWTGTNLGRVNGSTDTSLTVNTTSASGAPFNLYFHPTTTQATVSGQSGYGVTYNNNYTSGGNSLSTTALGAGIEPINQYGGQTFLLAQGCGYNGTPSNPTGSTQTALTGPSGGACGGTVSAALGGGSLASTVSIGAHPTAPAGTTYSSLAPSTGANASPFVLSPTNSSGGAVTATSGGNFLSLDGAPDYDGEVQQTISGLVYGQWYTLSFWWAVSEIQSFNIGTSTTGTPPNFPLTERIKYRLGNANGTSTNICDTTSGATPGAGGACVFSTATVTQNISHTFTGWMKESVTFRYVGTTGATTTLAFLSIGSPSTTGANGAPPMALLDGVSLADAPEPTTLALLTVGLAGVIFVRRPRRRVAARTA